MAQQFTNNARALLVAGITNSATSIIIESTKADLFPVADVGLGALPSAGSWFKATLQDANGNVEIVAVRTRAAGSGILSNVIRGYDNTTPLAFATGTVIGLRITAADIQVALSLPNQNNTFTGTNSFTGITALGAPVSGDFSAGTFTWPTFNQSTTGNAATATNATNLVSGGTIASSVTATTQAAKTSDTTVATTAFVDRLRSLLPSSTSGTLAVSDRGALVSITAGLAIPAGVFSANDVVSIYNNTAGSLVLTQGSSLTLRQAGTANTGNRSLLQRGIATIVFISSTEAVISGGGLT